MNGFDRIKRRFALKVIVSSGEEFYVREMTGKEYSRRDAAIEPSATEEQNILTRSGVYYALSICDDATATPIWPKNDDETDSQWGSRVMTDITENIQPVIIAELIAAIQRIGKPASPEAVAKN